MSVTKEKSQSEIKIKYRKPIQQSLFNKLYCKFLKPFLFFIPPYFKKNKKYVNVSKQQGLPYIICVENLTTKAVRSVELFGSYNFLSTNLFDKDYNLFNRGVKISSNIPNVNYKEILYGLSMDKFKVGLTYIMTTNQKQIFHQLKVVNKMICGNLSENTLIVSKDPYQHQCNTLCVKSNYKIDGLTTLVIPILEPKATVHYYFYPETLASTKSKKENFLIRFFKYIFNYFKKKEVVKSISKPYTIEVSNDTDEVKNDISIFGTYKNANPIANKAFNKHNELIQDGITIRSLTPNISYAEMLYYIMENPLKVAFINIRLVSGYKNQILSDNIIRTTDANGNIAQKTTTPTIEPNQHQIDCILYKQKFLIDGFTEFIVSELKPKTTIVYQFYPDVKN
jgi:hypothetical protein